MDNPGSSMQPVSSTQPGISSRPSGHVPVIAVDPEVIRVDDEPKEDGAGGGVTQSQGSQRKLTSAV